MPLHPDRLRCSLLRRHHSAVDHRWRGQREVDDEGRLYLPVAGEAWIDYGRGRAALVPGRAALIPPHAPRRFACPHRLELRWLHFRATLADGVDLFAVHGCRPSLDLDDPAAWHARFDRLLGLADRRDAAARLEVDGILRQFIAPFVEERGTPDAELERLRAVLARIEEHLADPLSVAGLARQAHWSPAHFSRRFRERFGRPPMTWVRERRVSRARDLLRRPGLTLADVAEDCGFGDAFHLSKVFLQVTGERPSTWRRRSGEGVP